MRHLLLPLCCLATMQAAESGPLVSLKARHLAPGPLASWPNEGQLRGAFSSQGAKPRVETVDGVQAVTFEGGDPLILGAPAPEGLARDHAWTCAVRAFNPSIAEEETLVAWGPRSDHGVQVGYGSSDECGAVSTGQPPHALGWEDAAPRPGRWHTLVYVFEGGPRGALKVFCDGELKSRRLVNLRTRPGQALILGACESGEGHRKVLPFSGSMAWVEVYDRALSPLEIHRLDGERSALSLAPAAGEHLGTLETTLTWEPGDPSVTHCDVFFGTDRAEVLAATVPPKGGRACPAYLGTRVRGQNTFGPLSLQLGRTYHWRIEQRDAKGRRVGAGECRSFQAPSGDASRPAPKSPWVVPAGSRTLLSWTPGPFAQTQSLYLGTSPDAVAEGAKPLMSHLDARVRSVPCPVVNMVPGQTLYWRIATQNRAGLPPSPGQVWTLRVIPRRIKVYLMGGQSNMAGYSPAIGLDAALTLPQPNALIFVRGERNEEVCGAGWGFVRVGLGASRMQFGPELTFARDMAAAHPDQVTAFIKCAWGGTNLYSQWRPPHSGGRSGLLYRDFVTAVREGLAALGPGLEPEVAGMVWMQGEADALEPGMHEDYGANLENLIADLRAEFAVPAMPFVIGQISTAATYDPPRWGAEVRRAQEAVRQRVPATALVPTGDFRLVDPWHYDAEGMKALGARFAAAMLQLEGGR